MVAAPIPPDEEERLRTLYSYEVLDTMEEESFDDVCRVAASVCEAPIALISLLDRTRQWFKARVGLEPRETERDGSFCAHAIIAQEDLLVVHDASKDTRLMDGPLVLTSPYIRFYAGVVLRGYNGKRLGTLCVIDRVARDISAEQRTNLRALARQVEALLELRRTSGKLRQLMEQREHLARFVIHDLNNPLAAVILSTEALSWDESLGARVRSELEQIGDQLLFIDRLIKNFQDVAASHAEVLSPKLALVHTEELVKQVVGRARPLARRSAVDIKTHFGEGLSGFRADAGLMERVIANLLYNALDFAPAQSEVELSVARAGDVWRLSVRDQGPGVAAADQQRVFEPFVQLGERPLRKHSRGLGLAFCRVAVEAHGGRIWVEPSEPHGSTFVVELPWDPLET